MGWDGMSWSGWAGWGGEELGWGGVGSDELAGVVLGRLQRGV